MKEIVLYPGNWLYNAGVVGFLRVLAAYEGLSTVESWFRSDGTVTFEDKTFQGFFAPFPGGPSDIPKVQKYYIDYYIDSLSGREKFEEWLASEDKNGVTNKEKYRSYASSMGDFGYRLIYFGNKFFATKTPFQNLVQPQEWQNLEFSKILQSIPSLEGKRSCALCGLPLVPDVAQGSLLERRLTKFQHAHFPVLGPSLGEFPNAFWNTADSLWICYFCVYLMLHRDLGFISLADKMKIFLNAPSFQLMWYLNRLVRELYERKEVASVREILGMSLIELALRLQVQLGVWTGMNIEVVSWQGNEISFYTFPYEVVRLLLDQRIASSLSEIGEMSILRMVLDRQFAQILQVGERLLAIALKPRGEWGEQDRKYINDNVHLERNRKDGAKLADFSSRLFSLYALIQEKLGGEQ